MVKPKFSTDKIQSAIMSAEAALAGGGIAGDILAAVLEIVDEAVSLSTSEVVAQLNCAAPYIPDSASDALTFKLNSIKETVELLKDGFFDWCVKKRVNATGLDSIAWGGIAKITPNDLWSTRTRVAGEIGKKLQACFVPEPIAAAAVAACCMYQGQDNIASQYAAKVCDFAGLPHGAALPIAYKAAFDKWQAALAPPPNTEPKPDWFADYNASVQAASMPCYHPPLPEIANAINGHFKAWICNVKAGYLLNPTLGAALLADSQLKSSFCAGMDSDDYKPNKMVLQAGGSQWDNMPPVGAGPTYNQVVTVEPKNDSAIGPVAIGAGGLAAAAAAAKLAGLL